MACIRIGVSGWRYAPWRGVFYPERLPAREELRYLASRFGAVEINGSFYSLQRPESYRRWYQETPPGFVFALKGPRYITHLRRLREPRQPLANFFASGLLELREKQGPILWQLPPNMRYDRERLEAFLAILPRDTAAAAALAAERADWMKDRCTVHARHECPLRHALEVRHESFLERSCVELLRRYGIALVVAESARRYPLIGEVTADFVYLRLHGNREMYRSGYGERALTAWARRIRTWHRGAQPGDVPRVVPRRAGAVSAVRRDVYCFFDNTDVKLRAPADAQRLMQLVRLAPSAADAAVPARVPGHARGGRARGSARPTSASASH